MFGLANLGLGTPCERALRDVWIKLALREAKLNPIAILREAIRY